MTGRLMTIGSATGGCGKTFFATNLAATLAQAGKSVLLVDLDLQFGEVAVSLQLKPTNSLLDGLYGKGGRALPREDLSAHIGELVVRHPSGMDVLAAPRDPSEADLMTEADAIHLLDVAMARYDIVVVDTPPALNEIVLAALDRSEIIVALASLDVPSLKNLSTYLDTLDRIGIERSRLRLILNKIDRDVGIDSDQAQDIFDGRFVGLIYHDRAVSRALNLGAILVDSEPRSRVTRQLMNSIEAVLPKGLLAAPTAATSSLNGSMLNRITDIVRPKTQMEDKSHEGSVVPAIANTRGTI